MRHHEIARLGERPKTPSWIALRRTSGAPAPSRWLAARAALTGLLVLGAGQPTLAAEPPAPAGKGAAGAAATAPAPAPAPEGSPKYQPPTPRPGFKPPLRGAPSGRVGGGSRGLEGGGKPQIAVLVPEHPGRAASEQPSLFWHIDRVPQGSVKLVLTVIEESSVEPLMELDLAAPTRAGIQRVDLADHAVRLPPGAEYEWSVAIVVDPQSRANDIIASGVIDRSDMTAAAPAAPGAPPEAAARSFAEQGFWYDALAAISDAIRAHPDDPTLRASRSALLQQVGLGEYAE